MPTSYRVIVADDDAATRTLLCTLLKRMLPDADVAVATNGSEALALYLQGGADLIVTDDQMPEMSGVELMYTLRDQAVQVPMLIISGQTITLQIDAPNTLTATKPLTIAEFTSLVQQLLQLA